MVATDLKKILEAHAAWRRGEADGARANLRNANLSGAYLRNADLSGANLSGANLRNANLRNADLSGAYLSGAYLSGANLSGAYLSGADLRSADLSGADLSGADLSGADLRSASVDDKTSWPAFYVCPDFGAFTAWKKLRKGIIAQLEIPAEAKRVSSIVGRKCRAEFARVVALHGDGDPIEGFDQHTGQTRYAVGEIVRPDSFDDNFLVECTHGIHFFITRREAEVYA